MLADKLIAKDVSVFQQFSKNKEDLERWQEGFSKSFRDNSPKSHSIAKQVYFPVNTDYHLLTPLVSSSLTQELFERFMSVRSKESEEIRQAKRENKYHEKIAISYPDIAVLKITASNHGNASPLNGKRGGKTYLLSCSPPHWQSSLKPPINTESIFHGEFDRRAWKTAKELQTYLIKLQGKKSNKEIREQVKQAVYQLIETLLDYAAEIQSLETQAGWSVSSKLKESHKLWLDPHRNDELFQAQRKAGDWQMEICKDFGKWLNKKLEHEKMLLAKIESDNWAKLLKRPLQEFEQDLESLL
jgi:CRISPR-associated protein Csy1